MPVDRFLQATFSSGEFDPLLAAREDVGFYYTSAARIENAIPLPQGGAKRREGLKALGLQRGPLSEVDISGFTYGAPNGGTAANLISDSAQLETTTGISTTAAYVVATIDAGSATRLSMLSIDANLVGGTIATGTLALQSSDDDITYTTRATLEIGTARYSRRFALAPDADLGTHRYWRVILDNSGAEDFGTDTINVSDAEWFTEAGYSQSSAEPGAVIMRRITTSIVDEYFAVITDRNVDIWTDGGVWKAAIGISHTDAQISEITTSQNLDTLVLYQEDNPPTVVQRLNNADAEWRSGEFIFDSVSQFAFDDATAGGQNEIQEISFGSMSSGDRFVFEFNGQITDEITWSTTAATNETNIEAALEGLDDFTDVTVTVDASGGQEYAVEWVNEDAKTFFATLISKVLDGSGTINISRKQYGRPDQDDLWSATRGYPRCGTFYQGRHWMGGFRSRPDVIVGSRVGDFTDFKEDADPVATSPLVLAPDIDEQVTIEAIYPGRSLQIFTSSAEIYIPEEPITPSNVALKVSSKRGARAATQPVDVQGGTFFVDRNGTNLREYLFIETEQSYTAEPISTLGGHLVQEPVSLSLRRSRDTNEPTMLYLINQGRDRQFEKVPAAAVTIDRAQQVTAFARMTSSGGQFKASAATQGGDVAFIVERQLAGNEWNYLELFDSEQWSDHSAEIENPDLDEATATDGQTVFSYTFTNPTDENDIGVFRRDDATDKWVRVDQSEYTLDTGAKTVTLGTGVDAGVLVAIAKRQTSFSTALPELDGITCYVHCDDRAVGDHVPSSGSVTIAGDEGFFFDAKIGLEMVPTVVLQPYKGKGGRSPTMQKQRIFRCILNMERTANIAVSMEGDTPRPIALTSYDGSVWDADFEETLYTGTKRVSGMGRWQVEPQLKITQTEPGPFLLRSVAYDIRF
jgi:hypothetical protein